MKNKNFNRYILIFIVIILIVLTSIYKVDFNNFDWKFVVICITFIIFNQIIDGPVIDYIVSKNKNYIRNQLSINDSFEKIDSTNNWDTYKKLYVEEHIINNFSKVNKLYYFKDDEFIYERKNPILTKKELYEYYSRKDLKEHIKKDKLSLLRKYKIHKLELEQDDVSHIDLIKLNYKKGKYISSKKHNVISNILTFLKIVSYIYPIIDISIFNYRYTPIKIIGLIFLLIIEIIFDIKEVIEILKIEEKCANNIVSMTKHILNNTLSINKFSNEYSIYKECKY